jgi:hypothetical protein
MLNFFGDGNQFSQKRLRAPQDVGLGRQKNFGNRDYTGEHVSNHVETDTFDNYEDEKMNEISNDLGLDIKNRILEEIRRRLPQIVQNSIPNLVTNQDTNRQVIATKQDTNSRVIATKQDTNSQVIETKQETNSQVITTKQDKIAHAVSTPADTIRLTLQQTPIYPALHTAGIKPTPYNELQQDYTSVAQTQGQTNPKILQKNLSEHKESNKKQKQPQAVSTPADTTRLRPQKVLAQGPGYAYEQVYTVPVQAAPVPAPTPLLTQSVLLNQNQPQLAPILVEDTREFKVKTV